MSVVIVDGHGNSLQIPQELAIQSSIIAEQLDIGSSDVYPDAYVPGSSVDSLAAVFLLTREARMRLTCSKLSLALRAAHYLDLAKVESDLREDWLNRYMKPAPVVGSQALFSIAQWRRLHQETSKTFAVQLVACLLDIQYRGCRKARVLPHMPLSKLARHRLATLLTLKACGKQFEMAQGGKRLASRSRTPAASRQEAPKKRRVARKHGAPPRFKLSVNEDKELTRKSQMERWFENVRKGFGQFFGKLEEHSVFWKELNFTCVQTCCTKWRWAMLALSLLDCKQDRVYILTDTSGDQAPALPFRENALVFGPHMSIWESATPSDMSLDDIPLDCLRSSPGLLAAFADKQGKTQRLSMLLQAIIRRGRPGHFQEVCALSSSTSLLASGSIVILFGLDEWTRLNGALGRVLQENSQHVTVEISVVNVAGLEGFTAFMKEPFQPRRGKLVVPRCCIAPCVEMPVGWQILWDAKRLCNVFWNPSSRAVTRVKPPMPRKQSLALSALSFVDSRMTVDQVEPWLHALIGNGMCFNEAAQLLKPTGFQRALWTFELGRLASSAFRKVLGASSMRTCCDSSGQTSSTSCHHGSDIGTMSAIALLRTRNGYVACSACHYLGMGLRRADADRRKTYLASVGSSTPFLAYLAFYRHRLFLDSQIRVADFGHYNYAYTPPEVLLYRCRYRPPESYFDVPYVRIHHYKAPSWKIDLFRAYSECFGCRLGAFGTVLFYDEEPAKARSKGYVVRHQKMPRLQARNYINRNKRLRQHRALQQPQARGRH